MASSNKTDKLQLPQWQLSDKPEMSDFNDAFNKVEDFKDEFDSHKAEKVSQTGGAHGFSAESGTFTPYFISTNRTPIATTQVGVYERVGMLIFIYIQLYMSDKNGATANSVKIGGLPFPPSPSHQALSASYIDYIEASSPWAGYDLLPLITSTSNISIHRVGGGGTLLNYDNVLNNFRVILSGVYRML